MRTTASTNHSQTSCNLRSFTLTSCKRKKSTMPCSLFDKMSPLVFGFIFMVIITTETVSVAVEVKKAAEGGEISFRLDTIVPSVKSIIWKQKTSAETVKVIEWDEDGVSTPHPRFSGVTTLDNQTGEITIKSLTSDHTGLYTIDVNSKEQEQKFTLTVMEPVPKPVLKKENIPGNADVVYLRCEYSEKIIWRNSAGETLEGSVITPKGESITIKNEGNKEKSYTCTLTNDVSEETSDPVYERDLFGGDDGKNAASFHRGTVNCALVLILYTFFFF